MSARRKVTSGSRFASNLKAARKNAGLTQAQLAERAGASEITLSKLETGSARPTFRTFLALVDALDVSPDFLVGWEAPDDKGISAEQRVLHRRLQLVTQHLPVPWLEQLIALAETAAKEK